jgi:hypothetical protein
MVDGHAGEGQFDDGCTDCRIGCNTTHLKDKDLGVSVYLRRRKLLMAACINGVERWRDNTPTSCSVALSRCKTVAPYRRRKLHPCAEQPANRPADYTPKAALLDTKVICCARNHGSCDIFYMAFLHSQACDM